MFELNLIRDRTEARARMRRLVAVVFLVLLLSAAATSGVMYLYLDLKGQTDQVLGELKVIKDSTTDTNSELAKWTSVKTMRNREIEQYYALDPIFDFRPLFGPIIRDLARFTVIQDAEAPDAPRRWFTEIKFERRDTFAGAAAELVETVAKPITASGQFVVWRKGKLGIQREEMEWFQRAWNDDPSSSVRSFAGLVDGITIPAETVNSYPLSTDPEASLPTAEKLWLLPISFSYTKGVPFLPRGVKERAGGAPRQ